MKDIVEKTVKTLKEGGVIVYPTDTVPGIGCMANNDKAVDRVFQIKQRPGHKALICLFKDWNQVNEHFPSLPLIPDYILNSNRPTSIILDHVHGVSPYLLGNGTSLAIRIPDNEFCQAILAELDCPLVSTSANLSGESTPQKITDVSPDILDQVDYVVSLQSEFSESIRPSKIVRITQDGEIQTIRD